MNLLINANRDPLVIGTTIHFSQTVDDSAIDLPLIQIIGLVSYRDDFTWKNVETVAGQWSPNALATKMLAAADTQSGDPLFILAYGNELYGEGFPATAEAIAAYCAYAVRVVTKYRHVKQVGIWNEPNITNPTWGGPVTAAQYIALLAPAYAAIKSARPDITVVGCELAVKDTAWLQAFVAAGGLSHCDVVGMHVYNDNNHPTTAVEWIRLRQAECAAVAGREVPFWITECGYSTQTGGVGEATQASFLTQYIRFCRALPCIKRIYWFELHDFGSDLSQREYNWGVMRSDGSHKPSYDALVTECKTL